MMQIKNQTRRIVLAEPCAYSTKLIYKMYKYLFVDRFGSCYFLLGQPQDLQATEFSLDHANNEYANVFT